MSTELFLVLAGLVGIIMIFMALWFEYCDHADDDRYGYQFELRKKEEDDE